MKRSEQLVPLSHDHHVALVVANKIKTFLNTPDLEHAIAYWREIRGQYKLELFAHFEVEEGELLPLFDGVDDKASLLAIQMIADHTLMRKLLSNHELSAAAEFAEILKQHVRFEERELFPWLEQNCDLQLLEVMH